MKCPCRFVLLAGLFFSAACTVNTKPTKEAVLAGAANRPITCRTGADCEEKWDRAVQWIKNNSTYEITMQSNELIETAGPSGLDDHLAFTATKKPSFKTPALPWLNPLVSLVDGAPIPPDKYDIMLFTRCNNWFGCTPSQLKAKADFADFVIGAPAAAKPVLGAKVTPITPDMAQKMKLAGVQGLAVMEITPHSIAEKAGLSEGDIIVQYDGKPVTTESALTELVSDTAPGKHINLDIIRGRVRQTIVLNF